MNPCLDTSVLLSLLFADAHTARAFHWLSRQADLLFVSHWAEAELFAVLNRRVRSGALARDTAEGVAREFDNFIDGRAARLPVSPAAGARAAMLARDPALKLSAADALPLALSSEAGHRLVTFDLRLAEAARLRGYDAEIPD